MSAQLIRLNKFLAERVGLSRREADAAIAAGEVTVNGTPAILGARIDKSDKICYKNKIIPVATDYIYVALNKPVGYVCSRRAQGSAPTIYDILPQKYQKLKTVGRLDKDSSGLILLTNDGDFAFQHTHPKFAKEKVYEVSLDRPLEPLHQQMISDYGVMLDDGPSRFLVIRFPMAQESDSSRVFATNEEQLSEEPRNDGRDEASRGGSDFAPNREIMPARTPTGYLVTLREGRNRQIRRTFATLGYRVTKLHRIQFGKYELSGLKPGECAIIKP